MTTAETPSLHHVDVADSVARRVAFWNWPARNGNDAHVTVCVHGLSRQSRDFDALAADLSAERRVVAVDVAGRGHSDWLADPLRYQIPTYVQDMAAVLATLKAQGAQRIDWVGTSMGGLIGLGVCGHPALQAAFPISRLVLNDVGPALQWAAIERIGRYVGQHMVFANEQTAADAMRQLSLGFGPHTADEWMALSRPMLRPAPTGQVRLHYDPAIAQAFRLATPESTTQGEAALWALYDAVQARTLVLRGAQSDLLSAETCAQMASRGPMAEVHEIAAVGHAPTLVSADQRERVRRFLDAP
jgi:pimeloyl-ACP methyl ester carboxylesterase